ncbi:MAG TPA: biopolymer transporter ExbD [Thermoanaerobaculia bacterium]|nr:biopolymer transporter ExbD [Thermoanaerobaculia bacterium]
MHIAKSNIQSEINVTPLVDVCLVLLIIFMVTLPAMVNGPVDLPKTETGEELADAKTTLQVTVKDDGSVYIESLAVRGEQVASEMRRLHELYPKRSITVRGDKKVPYGAVIDVLDASRAAGYENVGLVSQRKN